MPKVVYIEHGGEQKEFDIPEGWSLMQGATLNGVEGIEGECGGSCSCATCHVYVDEAWVHKIPEMKEDEDQMLECTASERAARSRLSCQIKMSGDLEGIILQLPEEQY